MTPQQIRKQIRETWIANASPEAIAAHNLEQKRIAALRNYARCHYGPRRLRLMANGEVHVYGRMPNSIETGWWLAGHDAQSACERFFGPDSNLA